SLAFVATSAFEYWRFRHRGVSPLSQPGTTLVFATGQALAVAATGGTDSPLLPAMAVMSLVLAIYAPLRWAVACLVVQSAALAAMTFGQVTGSFDAAVPELLGGGPRAGSATMTGVRGAFALLILNGAHRFGRKVRDTFEGIGRRAVDARDEERQAYAEQTTALTTLAAEIAHELKNPLASVKGLADLVARGLEGRPAERMDVLRQEVDRMQAILEEFLNFSRPLAPLAQDQVDLASLCRDVIALHEGPALERRASLRLERSDAPPVRCDRRKVKQILVNLVQNAIAASPAGGAIVLEVRHEGACDRGALRVLVRDEGPGLAPELLEQVFAPGVTTKEGGSGLGLTVSRLLARQHGGELTLRAGEGGRGCVGELVLPLSPQSV
ncbi:MAG TPA: HAMP domain-containing sensor histidine kinase, partial [Polyangiaceae bacterium]|nr:HAMP domain-containing sensor histidine kinase [Polyangiaceae bacterium]